MTEQRRCRYGTHLFDIVRGAVEKGSVCLCGSLRTEARFAEMPARWFQVVAMDGASSTGFTWIGERTP